MEGLQSGIGTPCEIVLVTYSLPDNEACKLVSMVKYIDFHRQDPRVKEIISAETGEVFYHA